MNGGSVTRTSACGQGDVRAVDRRVPQLAYVGHDGVPGDLDVQPVRGAAPLDLPYGAGELVRPFAQPDQMRPDAQRRRTGHALRGDLHPRPHERRRELVPRRPVQLPGRSARLQPRPVEHRDPVRQRQRLDLVVRDVQDRHVRQLPVQPGEFGEHLGPQPGVQRRQRLVEQQHLGPDRQRPRDGDALLLATGQLPGTAPRVRPHPGQLQRLTDPLPDLGLIGAARLQPERHVVLDPHMREQRVLLDDHPDAPPVRRYVGHVPFAEEHPPRRRPHEPGDGPQRGRLPGPGRSEQRHHLARLDGQVERVEDGVPVVGDAHGVEADHVRTPGNSATEPST